MARSIASHTMLAVRGNAQYERPHMLAVEVIREICEKPAVSTLAQCVGCMGEIEERKEGEWVW